MPRGHRRLRPSARPFRLFALRGRAEAEGARSALRRQRDACGRGDRYGATSSGSSSSPARRATSAFNRSSAACSASSAPPATRGMGASAVPRPDRLPILVQSERGYANLLKLVSRAFMGSSDGTREAELPLVALDGMTEGLIAFVGAPDSPVGRPARRRAGGCGPRGHEPTPSVVRRPALCRAAAPWRGCRAAVEPALLDLAYERDLPLVATNDVHFADGRDVRGPRRAALHRRRRPCPGRPPPADARASLQDRGRDARPSSPTCPRPSTTPSRSRAAAPSAGKRKPILPRFAESAARAEKEA